MEKAAQLAFENRKKKRSSTHAKSKSSKKRKSKKDDKPSKGEKKKVSHPWDYCPFTKPLPEIHDIMLFPDNDKQGVAPILEKIHRNELERTNSKRSTRMYFWPFHVLDERGDFCATRSLIRDVGKCYDLNTWSCCIFSCEGDSSSSVYNFVFETYSVHYLMVRRQYSNEMIFRMNSYIFRLNSHISNH